MCTDFNKNNARMRNIRSLTLAQKYGYFNGLRSYACYANRRPETHQ